MPFCVAKPQRINCESPIYLRETQILWSLLFSWKGVYLSLNSLLIMFYEVKSVLLGILDYDPCRCLGNVINDALLIVGSDWLTWCESCYPLNRSFGLRNPSTSKQLHTSDLCTSRDLPLPCWLSPSGGVKIEHMALKESPLQLKGMSLLLVRLFIACWHDQSGWCYWGDSHYI